MRQKRNIPKKAKCSYAIVVDGDTELWYFQMLKRNERTLNITLAPEIPQRKSLADQYSTVIERANHHDKVYWIIDFDVVDKETREAKKGNEKAIDELKRYCDKLEKDHKNVVVVIVNNPCFEYWLLLHFEETARHYDCYNSLLPQLKKYMADYDKSRPYYTKQDNDIYKRLVKKLPTAVENARKLKAIDWHNTNIGMCAMHLLFQDLGLLP